MLRQSLKGILKSVAKTLPDDWATKRPEELRPPEFLKLTALIYGYRDIENLDPALESGYPVWRDPSSSSSSSTVDNL